ncbi:MAG: DMT family transporter [Hyphomicrobiaceae bacterium]
MARIDAPVMPGPRAVAVASLMTAFASLLWSGNHIVGRAIAGQVPPLATGSIRWIVPALLLAPFVGPHLRRDWPEIRRTWPTLLVLSLVGGATFGTLQYVGLTYTTALNVSVLNSVAPVLIVAAGWLLFSDRVGLLQAAGIATSFAGVLAIIAKGRPEALAGLSFNVGDLIILFNMALWALYSASLRKRGAMHWMSFTFILATVSALATLPLWLMEHRSGVELRITPASIAALGYVSLFPSLLAYSCWSRGVEVLGSGRAGVFLHLVPLYSALIAGIALGERIEAYHLAGFALILVGVWLASRPQPA